MIKKILKYTLIILPFLIIAYILFIRPWQLTWGATDQEVSSVMPGDELLPAPDYNATRAITIYRAKEKVWPWLVQIGDKRGGWYSYDFLDNRGRPSAVKIVDKYQHLAVGDSISKGFRIKSFKQNNWILLYGTGEQGVMTWLMYLEEVNKYETRYITRLRAHWYNSGLLDQVGHFAFDTGEIFMMRKSMIGIKQRAEGNIQY